MANGIGRVGWRNYVSTTPTTSSIITNGLVLNLDAGNTLSYTGTGTTWTDLSGSGNNGTLVNGSTFDSLNSGSIVFDGINDYVSRPNFIGNATAFSVCHWINLSSNQTTRTIFSNYTGAGWVTGISDSATNVIKFYLGSGHLYATYPLLINTWYYVCFTYNNGNPTIYINGVLNNTAVATISFGGIASNNDIGRLGDGRQYFNGKISSVQVYNRALTSTEIANNFNGTKGSFGYNYTARTTAFATSTGITDTTILNALNTFDTGLISNGLDTKMKALYPFVGGTANTHKFNFMDARDVDAAFRLTFSGGWIHSSTGAKPNGTNTYADTKFIPLTNFTGNNGHISHYNRTNSSGVKRDISAYAVVGTNNIYSYPNYDGNNYSRMTGQEAAYGDSDSRGMYVLNKNSNVTSYYKNGSSKATTSSSSTMPEFVISIGGGTGGNYSDRESAFVSIGDSLSISEASTFYTLVQALQTSLSRQV